MLMFKATIWALLPALLLALSFFGGAPQAFATPAGSFSASTTAPGGDDTVKVKGATGAGAQTVTTVIVAGTTLVKGTHYSVDPDNASIVTVIFHLGSVPTAGQNVQIGGTTAGSGSSTSTCEW